MGNGKRTGFRQVQRFQKTSQCFLFAEFESCRGSVCQRNQINCNQYLAGFNEIEAVVFLYLEVTSASTPLEV